MSGKSDGNHERSRDASTETRTESFPPPRATMPAPMPARLDDYEIHEEIGRGGMGAVYKATHVRLKRTVALKVLSPHLLDDPVALTRFRREIEAVGNLPPHPNVVLATDARQIDQTHFLVMEYVEGSDLSKWVRRNGPLRREDACEIIRQAAVGLDHIASHGLVHRDLKPANLLLTHNGVVKILDLGLARFSVIDPSVEELTMLGQCLGTADYMAPEQWRNSASVDVAADLYSLGCTLFYLLTGHVPFSGPLHDTTLKKRNAHLLEPAPDLKQLDGDIPAALCDAVELLLAKIPSQRISSPRRLAELMVPLARGADLTAVNEASSCPRPLPTTQTMTETEVIDRTPSGNTSVGSEVTIGNSKTPSLDEASRRKRLILFSSILLVVGTLVASAAMLNQRSFNTLTNETHQPVANLSIPWAEVGSVREAQLWVRRDGDDARIDLYPFVTQGKLSSVADVPPLGRNDDFHLRVEFSEPIAWQLIWFDTSGRVVMADRADQPSSVLWYPGPESMMSIDPLDPAGQHLLLLVREDRPTDQDDEALQRLLANVVVSSHLVEEGGPVTRGPGIARKSSALSKRDYLDMIRDHLPQGFQIELPLFLPTSSQSDVSLAKRILDAGGTLTVVRNGVETRITSSSELTAESFDLVGIDLGEAPDLTGDMILPLIPTNGLQFLGLQNRSVSAAALAKIVRLSPELAHLNLHGVPLRGIDLDCLRDLPRLNTLWIGNSQVDDDAMKVLGQIQTLSYLWLGESAITDEGVQYLADLPNLLGLGLEHTRVSGRCLKTLSKMNLSELLLDGTDCSDDDVDVLSTMTGLQFLSLKDTHITPQGLVELRRRLVECRIAPEIDDKSDKPLSLQ